MNANDLAARYRLVRDASLALTAPLSAEDCCVQSMPDASPVKWHLAHTTWFFETFVLERWEHDFKPFHAAFRVLYNSYYNAVGDKHPRPQRGLLTRPELAGVLAYRADVDRRVQSMLAERAADSHPDPDLAALLTLGLHHEQQHQELILTDLKHLFSHNPLAPAYAVRPPAAEAAPALSWHDFPGGIVAIGHAGTGFCYDNETPRHRVFLEPYRLASRLVTNGEFLQFIEAGGYADPVHWLAEGWDWRLGREPPPAAVLAAAGGLAGIHPGRPRSPRSAAAGSACLVLRSRCLCALGRGTAADGGGMGERRRQAPGCRPFCR